MSWKVKGQYIMKRNHDNDKHNDYYKFIIGIVIVIIIVMLILPSSYWWFEIAKPIFTSNKGWDWLSFWGSYLSFLSSVIFGILIVWQNEKFRKLSDEKDKNYLKKEIESRRIENLPLLSINTYDVNKIYFRKECKDYLKVEGENILIDDEYVCIFDFSNTLIYDNKSGAFTLNVKKVKEIIPNLIYFSLFNCGNNTANNVYINVKCEPSNNLVNCIPYIIKNDARYFFITYNNSMLIKESDCIYMEVNYADVFQNKYKQMFFIKNNVEDSHVIIHEIAEQQIIEKSSFFNYN